MAALTSNEAAFLGTVLEGIVYGIFCLTFTLYINLRGRKKATGTLLYPLTTMFILCTALMCIDFSQQFLFIFRSSTVNESLLLSLNNTTTGIYVFVDAISQSVLIYRCWIMWDRNKWMIIVPSILTLTSFATGIGLLVVNQDFILPAWVVPFSVASFSLSLAVNTVITGMLILRLVLMHSESSLGGTQTGLRRLISLILETGILTFIGQLAWVVLNKIENPGANAVFGPLTMLYGLTPTVIIVRVGLGRSFEPGSTNVVESTMAFAMHSDPTSSITVLGTGRQDEKFASSIRVGQTTL